MFETTSNQKFVLPFHGWIVILKEIQRETTKWRSNVSFVQTAKQGTLGLIKNLKSIFYLAICSAVALWELIGIASQITNDIFDTAFKGIFVFML